MPKQESAARGIRKPTSQRAKKFTGGAIVSLTLVLVGTGLAYGIHREGATAETPTGQRNSNSEQFRIQPDAFYDDPWVYFIGDSYTEGTKFDSGPQALWTSIVATERGWYQRNFGVEGSGYATNGRNNRNFLGQVERSSMGEADAIVVSGGINDILRDAPLTDIATRVSETMTRIRSFAPKTPLTVLSVFNPNLDASPKLDAMNAILLSEAARVGATFVWASDLIRGQSTQISVDGLNPTDAGHQAIAAIVGPQLAQATRKSKPS